MHDFACYLVGKETRASWLPLGGQGNVELLINPFYLEFLKIRFHPLSIPAVLKAWALAVESAGAGVQLT